MNIVQRAMNTQTQWIAMTHICKISFQIRETERMMYEISVSLSSLGMQIVSISDGVAIRCHRCRSICCSRSASAPEKKHTADDARAQIFRVYCQNANLIKLMRKTVAIDSSPVRVIHSIFCTLQLFGVRISSTGDGYKMASKSMRKLYCRRRRRSHIVLLMQCML